MIATTRLAHHSYSHVLSRRLGSTTFSHASATQQIRWWCDQLVAGLALIWTRAALSRSELREQKGESFSRQVHEPVLRLATRYVTDHHHRCCHKAPRLCAECASWENRALSLDPTLAALTCCLCSAACSRRHIAHRASSSCRMM